MTTILYHGFRIMFATFVLTLSGCATLLILVGAAALIREITSHPGKVVPQITTVTECRPLVHPPDPKLSEGEQILEAYRCWP
jgi:hypothetical protein